MSPKNDMAIFSHGEAGMTRFPPNVEQITVVHDSTVTWLCVRRNAVELRFPLSDNDRRHLAKLLLQFLPDAAANARAGHVQSREEREPA